MTPEEMADEVARFHAEPSSPEVQARSDAMTALSRGFKARAAQRSEDVEKLLANREVSKAFNYLFDCAALEMAACLALDVPAPSLEEALAAHGLAPAMDDRIRTLRAAVTN